MSVAIVLASENNNYTRKSHLSKFYLSDRRGQFNKTFTRVAIVLRLYNNGYTCKLHVLKIY